LKSEQHKHKSESDMDPVGRTRRAQVIGCVGCVGSSMGVRRNDASLGRKSEIAL
jgi:hypothetical protein